MFKESTCHFSSRASAVSYYADYDCDEAEVERKIHTGEIILGRPADKEGASIRSFNGHYHYVYETTAPAASTPPASSGDPVRDVLLRCQQKGLELYIPPGQLDPNLFAKVKKEIVTWGGKWSTPKQCFVFKKDPTEKITHYATTGEIVNEKKNRQAFYTPEDVVEKVIECACIDDSVRVLEPSAGGGALARACVKAGAKSVDCCELDPHEFAALVDEGIYNNFFAGDFLAMTPAPIYDLVVMNPPFTKGQDVLHVLHAYKFLKPDSRLVAIVADKDDDRLTQLGAEVVERLPAGAFRSSGTNVKTRIILIRK